MTRRVRFAPSPTGRLHVGNVYIALANWLFARQAGGSSCCASTIPTASARRPTSPTGIEDDLRWLGLAWDEIARQSARLARYDEAAAAPARPPAGSIPATRRRRSWRSSASCSFSAASRRSMTARR